MHRLFSSSFSSFSWPFTWSELSFRTSAAIQVLLILAFSSCGPARQTSETQTEHFSFEPKRVVFYNVENLFDTLDQPGKFDEDFTPGGEYKWNTERYNAKLQKLASVVSWMNEEVPVMLFGMAEIENRQVVEALLNTGELASIPFALAHVESPDVRGIDVALAYDSTVLRKLSQLALEVKFPFDESETTRDILYVKGVVNNLDTLHIFVNHWPSRRGGEEKSEPKRVRAAEVLRQQVDSLFALNQEAQIIIMGDFNDEPTDHSIFANLNARGQDQWLAPASLYNFMYPLKQQGLGSYNYRGNWNMLDQMIVSGNMASGNDNSCIRAVEAGIFRRKEMMYGSDSTGLKPNRTYGGPNYFGGYSDHLPVYLNLLVRKR